jgi:hypothetical protein
MLAGDDQVAQDELIETLRSCVQALEADSQSNGNPYVLMTNVLLRGSSIFPNADEPRLVDLAAACIYRWRTLPSNARQVTTASNYQLGERWVGEVTEKLQDLGYPDPASSMAKFGQIYWAALSDASQFGTLVSMLTSGTESQDSSVDIEAWSSLVQSAVSHLKEATSQTGLITASLEVHRLAERQGHLIVDAINALESDSQMNEPLGEALSTIIMAISQAEAALKSDASAFEHAPENIRQGWTKLMLAGLYGEAAA